ncbi:hypothetical protein OESDEN_24452 [Oesophagostomum dentatum]|uniref:Uncharacterized protein n=1 Tax=Oesophagostomum dentatum TaxID=61180 RepID=A0A0B1RTD3_OESDE|nr:hypothetical protein OESDEN_24452 [Oesophagostomum dentatum]
MIERCEAAILRAVMQQACICINAEGRAKRKTATHIDDSSDPSNTPTRQKVSVQNMMRVLRGRVVPPLPQGAAVAAEASVKAPAQQPTLPLLLLFHPQPITCLPYLQLRIHPALLLVLRLVHNRSRFRLKLIARKEVTILRNQI